MSRDLTNQTKAAVTDDVVYPFFAVELIFDDGAVRAWTGLGDSIIGGETYIGLGDLINLSPIEETSALDVKGITLTLSGVSDDLVSIALSAPYQGRVCNVYFGIMGQLDANQLFSGYMDQMNISHGGESSTIEVSVENKLIDLERARVARFTSGYQKSIYPDDLGFDFVEDIQDKNIVWGKR